VSRKALLFFKKSRFILPGNTPPVAGMRN
jgi:hypothetical protein